MKNDIFQKNSSNYSSHVTQAGNLSADLIFNRKSISRNTTYRQSLKLICIESLFNKSAFMTLKIKCLIMGYNLHRNYWLSRFEIPCICTRLTSEP